MTGIKELKGVGLALSGGGFRASLFHLGVTRRLHELGILQKVTRLSTVSGGSILAGFLANALLQTGGQYLKFKDWEKEVSAPFRKFVRRDIRTGAFLKHVAWNWVNSGPRTRDFEKALTKRLTDRKLVELPRKEDGIEFIFLATEMKHGVLFKFTQDEIGTYKVGYTATPPSMTIAKAVAASACFPPIFGPMPIKVEREDTIYLTDGGVYDNTGMEPIWDETKHVFVSDCGLPFKAVVPKWYGSRLLRYSEIGRNQVGAQRRRALVGRLAREYESVRLFDSDNDSLTKIASPCSNGTSADCFMQPRRIADKPIGAYWRIESKKKNFLDDMDDSTREEVSGYDWYGYTDQEDSGIVPNCIACIRTDLDSFTTQESRILENHGYLIADIAVRTYAKSLGEFSDGFKPPHPELLDEDTVRKALEHSNSRLAFWRRWFDKA